MTKRQKQYNVFAAAGGLEPYPKLRDAALLVAEEFPGLSASAFYEQVRGQFYPRPDEYDMREVTLRLVSDGDLIYDSNWGVRLP